MSPRPRKPHSRDLPANLYRHHRNSFRYRHPVTGKFFGMGSDKAKAVAAARQLNSLLTDIPDLVGQVLGQTTVSQHINWMRSEWLAEQEWSENTRSLFETRMRDIIRAVGDKPVDEVTVKDIADMIEDRTPRVSNQIKQYATHVFKTAIARGLIDYNPAEVALKRREHKQRKRLTLEQFIEIRDRAPRWLQNAMNLSLVTLQRREDIVAMQFSDIHDDSLYVIQQKTKKYDTGYLRIHLTDQLNNIIKQCRDELASPFIIHRRPERKTKWTGQKHWTQIKPEMVTRQFKTISETVDSIQQMTAAERPSFHEIRALGIKLYKDAGLDPQHLAGHASAKMTKNYDAGHDEIRWVEVSAELQIK